ncbi:MAG: hypothetical protein COA52_00595 [Hyphomicrobiales bacterium]|nr:MAG: hypothetical protein COA52_00595 [Hyphomicrobiales bacterium]
MKIGDTIKSPTSAIFTVEHTFIKNNLLYAVYFHNSLGMQINSIEYLNSNGWFKIHKKYHVLICVYKNGVTELRAYAPPKNCLIFKSVTMTEQEIYDFDKEADIDKFVECS